MSSSNTPHDLGYKYLFSHPDFVRDLVKGFIDDDWLRSLDYKTLERVSDSYVTDDLRARSDDVVWRVRAGGEWVYLYLLFEFQSSVDPHMALRMMVYTGLLYQDLVKRGQGLPQAGLPPVLPIVLYNGFRPWSTAHNIADLIPALPEPMNGYIPQAKYLLIDENICTDPPLPSWRNLVAAVFQFERPSSPEAIVELVGLLAIWLKDRPDMARVMSIWMSASLHRKPALHGLISLTENLQELKTMLDQPDRWAQWAEEYKAQGEMLGLEKGMEKGLDKGKHDGLAKAALLQLEHRFPPLPDWVAPHLAQASEAQLQNYLTAILSASSLDDVFGSNNSVH